MKIKPYLLPYMKKLRRGPAITIPKDAGMIISYSGLDKNSKVLEIGTGSGFLTIQMAKIAKKVVTYEKRKEFFEVANENFKKLNLKNIKSINQDGFDGIKEKDFDIAVVDIPNAEELTPALFPLLNENGTLVSHSLSIEQGKRVYLECKKHFKEVFMIENLVREYDVDEIRTRPKHLGMMHTAYLIFARK